MLANFYSTVTHDSFNWCFHLHWPVNWKGTVSCVKVLNAPSTGRGVNCTVNYQRYTCITFAMQPDTIQYTLCECNMYVRHIYVDNFTMGRRNCTIHLAAIRISLVHLLLLLSTISSLSVFLVVCERRMDVSFIALCPYCAVFSL